jgi:hypothetical protein
MMSDNSVNNAENAAFEVFTAMTMKRAIFWDVTLCSRVEVD